MRVAVIAAALALAAAGCSGDATSGGSRIPICEVRFAAPDGFAPSETHEERYDDRIGVRLGFADDAGHELHVFAGIRGEFGEGLPAAGDVDLADGGTAAVLGGDDVWVVRWDVGDVCDPRVVLVNGFDRDGLQEVLSDAGLVASGDLATSPSSTGAFAMGCPSIMRRAVRPPSSHRRGPQPPRARRRRRPRDIGDRRVASGSP